jgi:hypothetical protein
MEEPTSTVHVKANIIQKMEERVDQYNFLTECNPKEWAYLLCFMQVSGEVERSKEGR